MTVPRANPLGWAAFELLTSGQINNLDIYNTQSLDGTAGGVYTLTTVGGRGDGYITLDASGATATPGARTAVLELNRPDQIDELHGLLVTTPSGDEAATTPRPLVRFWHDDDEGDNGEDTLEINAAGTGAAIWAQGGMGAVPDGIGSQAIRAYGGSRFEAIEGTGWASSANNLEPGSGMIAYGGLYSGVWTSTARLPIQLGNGMVGIGGTCQDTSDELIAFIPGYESGTFDIGTAGTGLFGRGGSSSNDGRGGSGGLYEGGSGIGAGSTVAGGDGIQAKGAESDTGSGGGGIIARGGDTEAGVSTGANAGMGGGFAGGNNAELTNIANAGDGIRSYGGSNLHVTLGSAGHGVQASGGVSSITDGSGNGNGLVGVGPQSISGTYPDPTGSGTRGAGVVGIGPSLATVYSIGVHGHADGASGAVLVGVDGTSAAGSTLGYGVQGLSNGGTAGGAGVRAISADDDTPALRLSLNSATPAEGHIQFDREDLPTWTSAANGHLFAASASVGDGSLFLGRATGWARVIDSHTPQILTANARIHCDNDTPTIRGYGIDSVTINATTVVVTLEETMDSVDDVNAVAMLSLIDGGSLLGVPYITAVTTNTVTIAFLDDNHTGVGSLETADFEFCLHVGGAPNAFNPW